MNAVFSVLRRFVAAGDRQPLGFFSRHPYLSPVLRLFRYFFVFVLCIPINAQASFLDLNAYSFGANQSIIATLGQISYITGCSPGIDDFIYGSADVYVSAGNSPGPDISGSPNTLTYIVLDEVLGNTGPGGNIPSGNYTVWIDECQDGQYQANVDSIVANISVVIPSNIDPLSSAMFASQLAATKAAATQQQNHWADAASYYAGLFATFDAITAISIATDPADFLLFVCTNVNLDTGQLECSMEKSWLGLLQLQFGVLHTITNQAFYYKGIAADPPDSNFMEPPLLDSGLSADIAVDEPIHQKALKFGEVASQGTALAHALLQAMERYQGAQQAGMGEYAYLQAHYVEKYARELAQTLPWETSTFQSLATSAESSGIDFVSIMNDFRTTQNRVSSSGLTPAEHAKLVAAGWTDQEIADALARYLSQDFSGLTSSTDLSTLATAMAADQSAAVTALNNFADVMVTEQSSLAAQLNMPFPTADGGGPYVVNEGTPITLDASASSHPSYASNQLSYAWDLNLDGVFDDATGATPTVTINHEMDGYIGVEVTAPTGLKDVAYVRMTVNNVNSAPQITSASPAGDATISFDGSQAFSVTATDPDGNPLTYSWDIDDAVVGSGNSYTYNASMPDVGVHVVTVTVADNSPLSPDTKHIWRLTVNAPDADGDGYPSNIDCNDNDPNVNPGATEIYLNGIDDDCNPATPDNPDVDGDGYDYTVDCNDNDPAVHPGADEVCNGIDDNCDGNVDEGFDADGDGYSICAGDCNDTDPAIHPGAVEVCNLVDDNCDGNIDEGFDTDGDGVTVCGGDCNDTDPAIHPGAVEVCNLVDDNCNGSIDEGFDADGDGVTTCGGDCDDSDPSTYPGAPELCDGKDNNCNGSVDEGVNDDHDGDGISVCGGDCNDANPNIHPGATEICNNIDDNCDGNIDEGFDADGDGYSTCAVPVADCNDSDPAVNPAHPEVFHNGKNDDCNDATPDDYAATFIIATDDSGRVYYAKSNGDGTWSGYRQEADFKGPTLRGVAIADYDNDGDLDFLVPVRSGSDLNLNLFLNDGADNFTNVGVVGTAAGNTVGDAYGMTTGDFNNDGDIDFLVSGNSRYVVQGMGDGAGHFTLTTIDTGVGNGRGVDVADFNHDGNLDYVRAVYSSGQLTLYLGDGTGNFTSAGVVADPGSDPYGVAAADFNNDGNPDIMAIEGSSGDAYFFAGNGDGTFAAGVYEASLDFGNHGKYDNYDFNRDGNQDLITSSYSSRIIRYYPGNGDGTFGSPVQVNPTTTYSYALGLSAPPGPPPVGDPVAFINPNPVTAALGATVNLSGQYSTDGGSIASYGWDFDDGAADSGVDVTHPFPSVEKDYHVKLKVTDNAGKTGSGNGLVRIEGNPPTADAGGSYSFGEAFANGGVYTVNLDGSASTDDGPASLKYRWNLGNGLSEPFSSGTIRPGLWAASSDAYVSGGEAIVTGAGSWGNRYLVTNTQYSRVAGDSYLGRVYVENTGSRNMMWGLKNTGTNYSYNQFTYAIYFYSSYIYIYEDGSSRGNVGSYSTNTSYDVRIDLKGSGARYFIRPTGTPTWTLIYDSDYSSASPLRLGATIENGIFHFDDFVAPNQISSEEKPTVTYPAKGVYNVALTVTDGVGQSDSDLTTVNLVSGAPPVADAGGPYTPGEAQANCDQWTVTFDGTASSDDVGIYSYEWDFGDGSTGTGATPTHTYAGPGTYTVTLTVADNALQKDSATTTVTTTPGVPPVADPGGPYSVDESAANAGLWTVNFDGTGSTDDVGLCDYVWDFGDGSTGTGATPTYQYAAAGTYTVTLTVRDNAHQSHTATTTVTVTANNPPVADSGGPYAVDENQAQGGQWTASFDASGTTDDYGIWTYAWDFGDGSTGSGVSTTHVYTAPGTYDVTLTVTDNGRQANSQTTQITVGGNGAPVADAGPSRVVEAGQPVVLDGSASTDDYGIYKYHWDFDSPSWDYSGALFDANEAIIAGANNWSNRYVMTQDTFDRQDGDSYTGRVLVENSGSPQMMWGLKNTGTNYYYTQFYYAIAFINGSVRVYENGSNRGSFGSYANNTSYDLRIDVKATGATYYYRQTGASAWTQLYDSSNYTNTPFRLGASVYAGVFHFSGFGGPGGPLNQPVAFTDAASVITATYTTPGTYHPSLTVTDNALQSDTASTVVTVVQGNPPVANSGGPYQTNEDIPTRLNGRLSSDDFGVKTYEWDFGDGESITTRNPWVDHRYTAAGSYTLTLKVTDFAGQSASDSSTVNVSADPVVAAVPWHFQGGIEVPHDTWSGRQVTLKAVAWSLHEPLTYSWDFGDGSAPQTGTVTDKRVVQATHSYTGVDGQPFVATVTITDADGHTATDTYPIRIRAKSLDIEINAAIDDGLWWLHSHQNLGTFAAGTYGNAAIDYGYWDNTNGYSGSYYKVSPTSSGVQAFEVNGHLEVGDVRKDPYVDTVARALRFLPTHMRTNAIGMQSYGDPDTNHNGIGIDITEDRPPYEVAQLMDALVASGSRDTYPITGSGGVKDRSYYDLVVDMVDMYAWGQYDDATVGGGWRYSWNSFPDNSVAQWGTIGMRAAEETWQTPIPQWVKDRNDVWLTYSYNGTGFGYTGGGNGTNTTPSGMVQLAFDGKVGVDDPATPQDDRDPRWATAEDYIANHWNDSSFWYNQNGSATCKYAYYGYYAFTKAMRTANPKPIVNLHATGLDWFMDDTDGIARRLVDRQQTGGAWPRDCNPGNYVGDDLSTAWSVLILTPTLFVQPPVADAGEDRVWGVDVPLTFDGSRSYHLDPFRSIVLYEWDLNGDGVYDTSSTSPTTTYTYSSQDYPENTLPRNIKVTLRVTDNNDPPKTDTDTVTITIAVPPHPPVAVAGGPYTATVGIPLQLDGSGSFDIDPTDFITAWDWDTNGDNVYGDVTGAKPNVTFDAPGVYNIGLRVKDNAVLNDVNGNGVQDPEERLVDYDFTTVNVTANNPPVANAGGPYSVDEGSSVTLDGSGSSDPDNNSITYAWDLDNNGQYNDATGVSPSFAGVDDGVNTIGLQVNDSLLSATATSQVTVNNVAPTVNAGVDQTITEGDTFTLASASFTDPGILDTHTATIDWGDGSAVGAATVSESNGNGSVAGSHTYADNGVYTVTVTVTDKDGGVGSDALKVTVNNAAPVVNAGGDRTINVNTALSLAPATFSDAGVLDTHTATIDWGDGSAVGSGTVSENNGSGTVAGNHTYASVGTYTVTVSVTDKDGDAGSDTLQVQVTSGPVVNHPPTADAGGPYSVDEGSSVTLDGSASADPDNDPLTYAWDFNNDGAYDDATGVNPSFTGGDNGVFPIGLQVSDGEFKDTAGGQVTVNNVAPTVNAGPDQTIAEGDTLSLAPASFTDPGTQDTHTAVIDWGDGSATTPGSVTESNGNGTVAGSHAYNAAGTYTLTVTVTDKDNGVGSDTLTVAVQPAVQPEQTIFDLIAYPKISKIQLTWSPVQGASGYNIYRGTTKGGPYSLLAAGVVTDYAVYIDSGLTSGVSYYYVVTSVTNGVESLQSNEASGTPVARTP